VGGALFLDSQRGFFFPMKRMFETQQSVIAAIITIALITLAAPSCQKGKSPTASFQAFYEALKNKDVAGYKRIVSKAKLQQLETEAAAVKRSLDELIKLEMDGPQGAVPDKLPETRNEKIEGDKATLEVKTKGEWHTVQFVKEDGEWKVAVED
jgi:hypothetical protein